MKKHIIILGSGIVLNVLVGCLPGSIILSYFNFAIAGLCTGLMFSIILTDQYKKIIVQYETIIEKYEKSIESYLEKRDAKN